MELLQQKNLSDKPKTRHEKKLEIKMKKLTATIRDLIKYNGGKIPRKKTEFKLEYNKTTNMITVRKMFKKLLDINAKLDIILSIIEGYVNK